jgi:hypothetical protein
MRLASMETKKWVKLARAVALLDDPTFRELCVTAVKKCQEQWWGVSDEHLSMLSTSLGFLERTAPIGWQVPLDEEQVSEIKRQMELSYEEEAEKHPYWQSRMEDRLQGSCFEGVFQAMPKREDVTPSGRTNVDVAATTLSGMKAAFHTEGPQHFNPVA